MSSQLPALNPTAYVGVGPLYPGNITFHNRDPDNLLDTNNFKPGDTWMCPNTDHIFMLMRDFNLPTGGKQADWVSITGGGGGTGIQNLRGDFGATVGPIFGTCWIQGDLAISGIETEGILPNIVQVSAAESSAGIDLAASQRGTCAFNSADFTVVNGFVSAIAGPSGTLKTLTGDDAVAVGPDLAGNINISGSAVTGMEVQHAVAPNTLSIIAHNATAGVDLAHSSKGVSAFNSANFTVVGGFVSAIPPAGGFTWVEALASATMVPNTGYYVTAPAVVLTLPAVAAAGTILWVQGTSTGWKIAQQAGQHITFNTAFTTTPGMGGSVSSVDTYDGVELLCIQADTVWVALNVKGNPTIV